MIIIYNRDDLTDETVKRLQDKTLNNIHISSCFKNRNEVVETAAERVYVIFDNQVFVVKDIIGSRIGTVQDINTIIGLIQ